MAAHRSREFSGGHKARIMGYFRTLPAGGNATAEQIASGTGLTVVQIDRRLHELEREELIGVVKCNGLDVVVNGFRVWELA